MLIEVAKEGSTKRFIETKYVSQVYVDEYDFTNESYTTYKPRISIYAMFADLKIGSVLLEDLGRDVDKATVDKKLQEWVNRINAANNGKTYISADEIRDIMPPEVFLTGD